MFKHPVYVRIVSVKGPMKILFHCGANAVGRRREDPRIRCAYLGM